MFLLPPSLRDWLPENHRVYFVSDVVDQLDLSKIELVYEKDDPWKRQSGHISTYKTHISIFAER
jgi:hypothetical protein